MSKIRRGAKGSKKTKVLITSAVAGGTALLVSLGIGIGALINNIKSNNNEFATLPEDITRPTYTETFSPESESLETNQTVEDIPRYDTEETVQNQTHVTDDTYSTDSESGSEYEDIVEDTRYQDLLGSLTTKAQAYCSEHRTSLSQMQVIGLSNIAVNGNQVLLKGDFKNKTQFGNYIITLQNDNSSDVKIFNIGDNEIAVDDFIGALNEVLSDKSTTLSLDARQRIVDFDDVDKYAVVENISEGLTNPDEINNLTQNIDNASFSLLLNDCVKNDNTYKYSYTVAVYTKQTIYASKFTFDADKKLTSSALLNMVKDHVSNLDTVCTTVSTPTDNFEKALHNLKNSKNTNLATTETAETLYQTTETLNY